jgi:hypothetical protein
MALPIGLPSGVPNIDIESDDDEVEIEIDSDD